MRTCVYTVLLGGYDALLPQDVAHGSRTDFICFTDDPTLRSDTWDIELVEPRFPQDLHRSSRVYKIVGHERLAEYGATMCVDASVRLRRDPEEIIEAWLADGHDIALAQHSFRELVLDEFDEVVRLNYDDRARVFEQLVDYSIAYPDVLEAKPHWGGMLVRRNLPQVHSAMRLWFDHVLRYSRRDQLSLMVALLHGGATFNSIPLDNFDSDLHEWPVIERRRVAQGKAPAVPSGPLIAELRRARKRIEEYENEHAVLGGRSVRELVESEAALRSQAQAAAELRESLDRARRELEERDSALRALSGVRGAMLHLERTLKRRVTRRD